MAGEKISTPEYIAGFNEGYAMAKNFPGLAQQLADKLSLSEHNEGFKEGWQELAAERERLNEKTRNAEHHPKWMRLNRLNDLKASDKNDKNRDLGIERE